MNKYTQPVHNGISTIRERKAKKKPHKKRRKYLREPTPRVTISYMDETDPYWFLSSHTMRMLSANMFSGLTVAIQKMETIVKNPFKST